MSFITLNDTQTPPGTQLLLDNDHAFAIERIPGKLRLIALQGSKELACRKTAVKPLSMFLNDVHGTIFKGRLQLRKHDKVLIVYVTGIPVGMISTDDFASAIKEVSG